jgi:hypothetical protein
LKLFKDIPKCDLEMVLPGTQVTLSRFDKGMIFYPLVTGFCLFFYNILSQQLGWKPLISFAGGIALSWGLASVLGGYAYKSYYTYTVKKTQYSLQLTQSLYYQSLGSNAAVVYRLFDEAFEQECREVLLAYYYLWHHDTPEGWTLPDLDDRIEQDFEKYLDLKIDFEIDDAIHKLKYLRLLESKDGRFRVIPIDRAIQTIHVIINEYLNTGKPMGESEPVQDKKIEKAIEASLLASIELK